MKKSNQYILEGTTFLGFLTAILYFFPYTYRSSYLSYFGVPAMYQNFDIKTSVDASLSLIHYVLAIIVVLGACFCFYAFVDKIIVNKLEERAKKSKTLKRTIDFIGYVTCLIIFPFFIIYLIRHSGINVLIIALFSIVAAVGCIYIYIFLRRRSYLISNIFVGTLVFFFIVITFLYLGQEDASNRSEFYVVNNDNKDYIVMGMKDEFYSVVRFDKKDNKIIQEYKLIPILIEDIYLERLYLDEPPVIIKKTNLD